jgi:hypothetical protein
MADKEKTERLLAAFREGEAASRAGQPDTNPYGNSTKALDDMATQWQSGYRNTRGAVRFDAIIAARRNRLL